MEPVASKGRRGYIRDATGGPGLEAGSMHVHRSLAGARDGKKGIMTRHWANDIGQRDQKQTTWTSDRHRGMVAEVVERGGQARPHLGRIKLSRRGPWQREDRGG